MLIIYKHITHIRTHIYTRNVVRHNHVLQAMNALARARHSSCHQWLLTLVMLAASCLQKGWTSLIVASEKGHMEVADKLIAAGANLDLQDEVRENCVNCGLMCLACSVFTCHTRV